jgi:lactase-phlorizin hydrolase
LQVKLWITFNEPWVICVQGYGLGDYAPGLKGLGTYVYQCGHNVLRSHARAYRRYKEEFDQEQGGTARPPKKHVTLFL